jgi:hypothetical protein
MTQTRDNGGPAFPFGERKYDGGNHYLGTQYDQGMTLRDWFAGQSIQAAQAIVCGYMPVSNSNFQANVAYHSYRIADAMIEARKGGSE